MTQASPVGFVNELRARGFTALPAPREAKLEEGTTLVRPGWALELDNVDPDDIAAVTLRDVCRREHSVDLRAKEQSESGTIRLVLQPGAVAVDADPLCGPQAYRLTIAPDRVEVVGNGPAGLFYGVQTLVQLLDGDGRGEGVLPLGQIVDWPTYPLRIVHWDTKHHQDRPETLRRFIDQLAAFKINAVAFELEDKFEYPSHPIIGAPGAFTTAELADLTRYALARHVQIIPNIQAPAHLAYALKHDEFAHLRCDGSNYMACMDDPAALRLIFDMYDDVLAATPGVDYFLVSTDEIYHAGICEKYRKPYNPENRGKTWCEFANKANRYLRERGRRVIMWIEWPLRAGDVELLDADIIDGVIGTDDVDEQLRIENARGMRQLCYVSMQGGEHTFPHYFAMPGTRPEGGRLADAREQTLRGKATRGRPIGTFSAAWDDQGLHNETFWLGWAAMGQGGWTPGAVTVEQNVADFMDLFYGRGAAGMVEAYCGLQAAARFCEGMWDRVVSTERPPAYGNSEKKFPFPRHDRLLVPPPLPTLGAGPGGGSAELKFNPEFRTRYERALADSERALMETDRVLALLQANLVGATRNRYNIEVLLTVAHLQRHTIEMLRALAEIEDVLGEAAAAHAEGQARRAANLLTRAHGRSGRIVDDLSDTYARLKAVWEVSRFEKGRSVDGRHFVHVMDDVKDHTADRRADLSYLIAAEQRIGLPAWRRKLADLIAVYSRASGVAARVESPHE